ncbi:hypothetical protein CP973_20830 [Streptomyces albofaciens JCM 4342]|nr:hypothetical protein CP973_20830 [Streptomyces albofaciens JCM 4342]
MPPPLRCARRPPRLPTPAHASGHRRGPRLREAKSAVLPRRRRAGRAGASPAVRAPRSSSTTSTASAYRL